MAKLTGPLLSETAAGKIGPILTYSHRTTGAEVRYQKKQKDYTNNARALQRAKYTNGVAAWNALTDEEKEIYKTNAIGEYMTGYNFFMGQYMLGLIAVDEYLLLENGNQLLLENDGKILLQ